MKINNIVIIAILKSNTTDKLIKIIPGVDLLLPSLPGLTLRMQVESLDKPRGSTRVLEALPGKLDIKRLSPTNSLSCRVLYGVDDIILVMRNPVSC